MKYSKFSLMEHKIKIKIAASFLAAQDGSLCACFCSTTLLCAERIRKFLCLLFLSFLIFCSSWLFVFPHSHFTLLCATWIRQFLYLLFLSVLIFLSSDCLFSPSSPISLCCVPHGLGSFFVYCFYLYMSLFRTLPDCLFLLQSHFTLLCAKGMRQFLCLRRNPTPGPSHLRGTTQLIQTLLKRWTNKSKKWNKERKGNKFSQFSTRCIGSDFLIFF